MMRRRLKRLWCPSLRIVGHIVGESHRESNQLLLKWGERIGQGREKTQPDSRKAKIGHTHAPGNEKIMSYFFLRGVFSFLCIAYHHRQAELLTRHRRGNH